MKISEFSVGDLLIEPARPWTDENYYIITGLESSNRVGWIIHVWNFDGEFFGFTFSGNDADINIEAHGWEWRKMT